MNFVLQHRVAAYTILQLDKATQTDESCIFGIDSSVDSLSDSASTKSEKVLRQRLQRVQQRTGEHSVSSQTLSPIHSECRLTIVVTISWDIQSFIKYHIDFVCLFAASPVSIPPRSCAIHRPMRSSVEGLNQEIEKLVLVPGQPHSCRPESSHVNASHRQSLIAKPFYFCIPREFVQTNADVFSFFFFSFF